MAIPNFTHREGVVYINDSPCSEDDLVNLLAWITDEKTWLLSQTTIHLDKLVSVNLRLWSLRMAVDAQRGWLASQHRQTH